MHTTTLTKDYDLKWQVSQHFQEIEGHIYIMNNSHNEDVLGFQLNIDELGKQKFLSYSGFSRLLKTKSPNDLSFKMSYLEKATGGKWRGAVLYFVY